MTKAKSTEQTEVTEQPEMLEIGEPDFKELQIDDADITEEHEQELAPQKKYGAESLAKGVVGAVSMVSLGASKALNCDLALTEEEAEELHSAVSDYAATFDNAQLPPWAVLLMVTGALAGNKYMTYLMHKEKVIEGQNESH